MRPSLYLSQAFKLSLHFSFISALSPWLEQSLFTRLPYLRCWRKSILESCIFSSCLNCCRWAYCINIVLLVFVFKRTCANENQKVSLCSNLCSNYLSTFGRFKIIRILKDQKQPTAPQIELVICLISPPHTYRKFVGVCVWHFQKKSIITTLKPFKWHLFFLPPQKFYVFYVDANI